MPWYSSSQIGSFFGGQPTAQQIQSFDNTVLQRVQQTFSQSGLAVSLTANPNVAAAHTISLVSNTSSASLSDAIGMTQVGKNGFSFIDHITPSSQSLDQLQWIVAHNIAHELMLALGVTENYDQTGKLCRLEDGELVDDGQPELDVQSGRVSGPRSGPCPENNGDSAYQLGAQVLPPAVPEPATLALWASAAVVVLARQIRSRRCRACFRSPLRLS